MIQFCDSVGIKQESGLKIYDYKVKYLPVKSLQRVKNQREDILAFWTTFKKKS